ncbi:SRPBCC family protein [Aquimarina sp. 433]
MKYLKYLLIAVVAIVLIFFGIGLFTSSVSYENEIVVNKPANESWAVMSDESNLPKWIEGFLRTEHVSGTPNTVAAVSNVYIDEGGEEMMMTETITAMKPNELMAMVFSMDFMDMEYEMSFDEDNGKTTITSKSMVKGNSLMAKSMIALMKSGMKAQEDKNLAALKKLIDDNTKEYTLE